MLAGIALAATSAYAGPINVNNHSFENGTTGWVTTAGADLVGGVYSDPMPPAASSSVASKSPSEPASTLIQFNEDACCEAIFET